jgi:predicted 3-demethylubiquinone-9 3-methyltransferase (glyoxalase superfamily)
MQKTTTFLMFVGKQCGHAEEAINFYVSLFPGSQIKSLEKWKAGEPGGQAGLVKQAVFTLDGQDYMASENAMEHQFSFTPAISLFVNCENEDELHSLFEKLSRGGQVMMPLGDYGFSKQFGWVSDKYGVSWQLNLA